MPLSSVSFQNMTEFFWEDDSGTWAFSFPIPNPDINSGGQNELGKKNPVVEVDEEGTNIKSPTLQMEEPDDAGPSSAAATSSGGTSKKKKSKKNGDESKDEKSKGKKVDESSAAADDDHDLHIWTERERRKKMRSMFANLHALLPHLPPKADKSTIVDEAISFIKRSEELLAQLQKKKEERRRLLQGTAVISCYGGSARNKLMLPPMAMNSREAFLANQPSFPLYNSPLSNFPRVNNYPPAPTSAPAPAPTRAALATFTSWVSPNVILSISGDNAHINISCVKSIGLLTTIIFLLEKYSVDVVTIQVSSDQYRCMYMIHARPNGALQQLISHEIHSVEEKFQQAAAEIMDFITSM